MRSIVALTLLLALAGCSIDAAPPVRPESLEQAAGTFRSAGAQPISARPLAQWPDMFGDPQLSALVDTALARNFDVRAAMARVDAVNATLGIREAALLPTVGFGAAFSRARTSGTVDNALPRRMMHNWSAPLQASYDVDLWGRLRGEADVARQDLLRAAADTDTVRLRVATDIANDYLTLHYVDDDIDALRQAIELRSVALGVVQGRVRAGVASDLDALRAASSLDAAKADLTEAQRLRANLVDAIAVLSGESPTTISTVATASVIAVPDIPPGLPAEVLAHRPDVFAAGRQLDAKSRELGIARTAWLPSLTLTAEGGFASRSLRTFLDRNSSLWGLGLTAAETVFDGGRRDAAVAAARAAVAAADANYRATAIEALREVQDALNDIAAHKERIRYYESESESAAAAARLSLSRYRHGYVSYLEVIDADRDALEARRQLIHSRQAAAAATVSLVRALGGGWNASDAQARADTPAPPAAR